MCVSRRGVCVCIVINLLIHSCDPSYTWRRREYRMILFGMILSNLQYSLLFGKVVDLVWYPFSSVLQTEKPEGAFSNTKETLTLRAIINQARGGKSKHDTPTVD